MAKGKYEYWISDDGITLLRGWAREGFTDEQISKKMGIGKSTLYRYMNDFQEIRDTLKKGKEIPDFNVEDSLYKKALAGDVTAMIFWLKNRRPDRWRDKQETSITGTVNNPFDQLSVEDLIALARSRKDEGD